MLQSPSNRSTSLFVNFTDMQISFKEKSYSRSVKLKSDQLGIDFTSWVKSKSIPVNAGKTRIVEFPREYDLFEVRVLNPSLSASQLAIPFTLTSQKMKKNSSSSDSSKEKKIYESTVAVDLWSSSDNDQYSVEFGKNATFTFRFSHLRGKFRLAIKSQFPADVKGFLSRHESPDAKDLLLMPARFGLLPFHDACMYHASNEILPTILDASIDLGINREMLRSLTQLGQNFLWFVASESGVMPIQSFKPLLRQCAYYPGMMDELFEHPDDLGGTCLPVVVEHCRDLNWMKFFIAHYPTNESFQKVLLRHTTSTSKTKKKTKKDVFYDGRPLNACTAEIRDLLEDPACWPNCRTWLFNFDREHFISLYPTPQGKLQALKSLEESTKDEALKASIAEFCKTIVKSQRATAAPAPAPAPQQPVDATRRQQKPSRQQNANINNLNDDDDDNEQHAPPPTTSQVVPPVNLASVSAIPQQEAVDGNVIVHTWQQQLQQQNSGRRRQHLHHHHHHDSRATNPPPTDRDVSSFIEWLKNMRAKYLPKRNTPFAEETLQALKLNRITESSFLCLTRDDLTSELGIVLGDALDLFKIIEQVHRTSGMSTPLHSARQFHLQSTTGGGFGGANAGAGVNAQQQYHAAAAAAATAGMKNSNAVNDAREYQRRLEAHAAASNSSDSQYPPATDHEIFITPPRSST